LEEKKKEMMSVFKRKEILEKCNAHTAVYVNPYSMIADFLSKRTISPCLID